MISHCFFSLLGLNRTKYIPSEVGNLCGINENYAIKSWYMNVNLISFHSVLSTFTTLHNVVPAIYSIEKINAVPNKSGGLMSHWKGLPDHS